MNLLVVGSGMYVTGREQSGVGTILAALCQYSLDRDVNKVVVVSKSSASEIEVADAVSRINSVLGSELDCEFRSVEGSFEELEELHTIFNFNAAIVAIPDHLHFSYTEKLIRLGIHCLVVKPLVPTLKEHLELIELAEKHQTYCAVEFNVCKVMLTSLNFSRVFFVQISKL